MRPRYPVGLFRRWRNREGSVVILVAVSIAALLAFAILAIDGAILMTAKTQLQNAADAAALAGASGLAEGSQDLAVERAIATAGLNSAVQQVQSPVVITAADISFPEERHITVVTHRTQATGDPLRTYFLRVVDLARPNTTDVTAVAEAEVSPLCGTDCLKPWGVPDRWDDLDSDGECDAGEYDPVGTGYMPPGDVGVEIVLKVGSPGAAIVPGQFFPVCFPPLGHSESPFTGGAIYREWIRECEPYTISVGDSLLLEPGNMVGPTIQGVDEIIAADPGAYWDVSRGTVMGSAFGTSPRVIKVVYIDPSRPPDSGRQHVFVAKIGAFFLERTGPGSRVTARFMAIATPGVPCEDDSGESFVMGYILVR